MNLWMIVSLGIGVAVFGAGAAWYFLREASTPETDLGSISRNWIMEHKNDRD
jgi:hypothetical protein